MPNSATSVPEYNDRLYSSFTGDHSEQDRIFVNKNREMYRLLCVPWVLFNMALRNSVSRRYICCGTDVVRCCFSEEKSDRERKRESLPKT